MDAESNDLVKCDWPLTRRSNMSIDTIFPEEYASFRYLTPL